MDNNGHTDNTVRIKDFYKNHKLLITIIASIIILFPVVFSLALRLAIWITSLFGYSAIVITDTFNIDFKSHLTITISMVSCAVSALIAYNTYEMNKEINAFRENERQYKNRYYLTRLSIEIENNINISTLIQNRAGRTPEIKSELNDEWYKKMDDYSPVFENDIMKKIVEMYKYFEKAKCCDHNSELEDKTSDHDDILKRIKSMIQ